jgi:hypothetical protein
MDERVCVQGESGANGLAEWNNNEGKPQKGFRGPLLNFENATAFRMKT